MKNSRMQTRQQMNHHANTLNDNKGTNGTNNANAHVHGNRGKQLQQSRGKKGQGQEAEVAMTTSGKQR